MASLAEIEAVLDQSITPKDYLIAEAQARLDLRQLDFEALAERFKKGHQRTELERLRGAINQQLGHMIRLNRQRMDYRQQFDKLIDQYNSGSRNIEQIYQELLALVKALNEEEQRHLAEGLTEEELALFDLLVNKPEIELTPKERQAVKKAARELLAKLKDGKLTLDWRKHQQAQAEVRITIEDILDEHLPAAYTTELYHAKCDLVYQHVYEHYYGEGRSTYASMPLAM